MVKITQPGLGLLDKKSYYLPGHSTRNRVIAYKNRWIIAGSYTGGLMTI